MERIKGWITAIAVFSGLVLLVLLQREAPPARAATVQNPNVIFVTVDTLRFDHTPFGNYSRQTMPNTARFFQHGTNFVRAETVRTATTPAYASMFTGYYPYRHGVRDLYFVLNDQVETLSETLARKGYSTAAFVSSFAMIERFSGFKQGFQVYDDYVSEKELNRENYERSAQNTVKQARKWLEKNQTSGRPFFLFLHFIDPHGPYLPPGPYDTRYRSTQKKAVNKGEISRYQLLPGVLDLYRYIDLYDGEISNLDNQLEVLYETFEKRGLLENTWFLFAADHGESLGERGLYFSHGHHYFAEQSRIPMVLLPPVAHRTKVRKVDAAVSMVDVYPTILDAIGIAPPKNLDGESLLPAIRGEKLNSPYRFVEKLKGSRHAYAIYDTNHKMIFKRENREIAFEFYNLNQDPAEQRDIMKSASIPSALEKALNDFVKRADTYKIPFPVKHLELEDRSGFVKNRNGEEKLTPEDEEKLRALGYVD